MKNSCNPFWLSVLNHFDEKRYCQNGLTIPFLVGANQILSENKNPISIQELLKPIIDMEIKTKITMLRCHGIGEFVFGIVDWETKQLIEFHRKNGKELFREIGCLNIIDRSFEYLSDKEVIVKLEEKYISKIENGDYSKISGKWGPFSDEDINRINELKT